MTTITGTRILLTGASGAIGTQLTHLLTEQGATVIGVSRSAAKLERLGREVAARGSQTLGKFVALPWDISCVEELPLLLQECDRGGSPSAHRLIGRVDILINNAGIEIYKAFPDYLATELPEILTVNLTAAMELTRLLLPQMLGRNAGHIVNVASVAGKIGHPYDSVYSASKAGLLMWSDALRQELADTGVKMSTICPGYVAQAGLLAATGISAPRLAGISQPQTVAGAVVKAIAHNQAEIVVNGNPLMTSLTKLLLASEQLFPRLKDVVNRWLGVTNLNQKRIIKLTKNIN